MTNSFDYEKMAQEVGALVNNKNAAYGNSFHQAGDFLKLLYPNGIPVEAYTNMLCIVRIFDKLKRIATDRDALGENPFADLVGYGLLGMSLKKSLETKVMKTTEFTSLSSHIKRGEYDPEMQSLTISFVNNAKYEYLNVPPDVWEAFLTAPSHGKFFAQYIKGKYDFMVWAAYNTKPVVKRAGATDGIHEGDE